MRNKYYILLPFLFVFTLTFAQPKLKLDTFARGFNSPIDVANDGFTSRVFVGQQNGVILVLDSAGSRLDTFIDLRTKVQFTGEEGFLGFTFHPDFQHNGYFYTYYTKKNTTNNLVARYKVTANPTRATIDSELIIINFSHPTFTNHNGGCIKFGKDDYLYIGLGDGGSGGDPNGNAQNKNAILGKLLRLNVNRFDTTYTIPPTNPFAGQGNVKQEIWAYGLRNPWRYTFDRETGDLWLADVGQDAHEEVNFHSIDSSNGENYGWRCYEGVNTYNTSGCTATNYKFPFFTYDHNNTTGGFAVTGGFIYKGNKYSDFRGYYIFADYVSGNFWLTKKTGATFSTVQQTSPKQTNVSSFGEDLRGELYATNLSNGVVYKLRELCSPFHISLVNQKNPSCPNVTNGSIQLTSAGANTGVRYSWSNGNTGSTITNLAPDKYIVIATDSVGCVRKDSFILVNADTLRTFLTAQNPSCPNVTNGQITAQTFDGNGTIFYNWSNGGNTSTISNLAPNKYVITATDSVGCSAKDSVTLYNADTLDKPFLISSNDTLFASNGFSYRWIRNDSTIAGATQAFYKLTNSGQYQVEITDINGCKAISDAYNYIFISVKNKNSDIEKFSLYPNPASDNLTIDISFNAVKKPTIKISNTIGQIVYEEKMQGKDILKTISLQQLPKGLYQLSVVSEDGKIISKSFTKE